ncbi:MAG: Ni/Fe hydrogenase subunit alpha [Deltaproteobacteria bacterium]|nr:Ni/Fe hydrogenase subunit alpha [Deltaproteobacteria bacterium]
MAETIVIQPVTRIEGHAKIQIFLDDTGNVSDTRVNIVELRGFEQFCVGRPVEELPRIVPRICGVCPWAHHLASAKACDGVFGIEPPPAAKNLRELAYCFHMLHSHILHFFVLSGPDFVLGPGSPYETRNVIGIVNAAPDIAKAVVRNRWLAQMATQKLGGKGIHPDVAVPGGWAKPATKEELEELKKSANELLEFSKFAIDFAVKNIFPKYLDVVKTVAVIKTGFLGLVKDGADNFYEGKLRMMKPDGSFDEFATDNYLDYIAEHVEPWTYLKFPYAKKWGAFDMDLDNPSGIYRTNALARVNVSDRMATPLADKALSEFRAQFGRPSQLTHLYHWARLIEMLYAAERAVELLNDPQTSSPETWAKVAPKAGRGIGVVEAPRGTLIHDYETDANGIVTNVNIIVGTTHNNAPINMSVKQAAKTLIKDGKYDEGILNTVEMSIRAYDPCFSCATHELDGRIPVRIDLIDANGCLMETLK